MNRKLRLAIVVAVTLVLCSVLGISLETQSVQAAAAYTVTFQAQEGHTVALDGSHLKIDGQYVDLQNGSGTAIGTVTVDVTSATINVDDGTPGQLNYNSNSFTLYDTNGHTPYSPGTEISSNTVFMIEDYADPGNGSNAPGNDPGNNQQPGDPGMNFALQIRVGNITKVVTAEDNVIQVEEENLENLSFWVEEFRDLNDGTVIPLQNVGNNSGAQDAEGRNPLEVGTTERTEHQWVVNLQYHNEDDPVEENRNCPPFYYVNLTFISANYNGVKLDFSKKPDMYQDTVYPDKVDITGTTAESPAVTGVYYDADDFTLSDVNGTAVSSIAVTGGIPASAVTITGNTVKFNSGYYATIPLTITLANGTVGYLSVERLGMEIRSVHPGIGSWPNVLHGSQNGSDVTTASGANTYNVVAVFYYDGTKSYADYNVIANLTFADGHTETKVVSGFGEKASAGDGGATKGGDYLVWSGASADAMPTSVSCTAVKAGATGGSNFGGALFGAGKGVTKTKQGTEYK